MFAALSPLGMGLHPVETTLSSADRVGLSWGIYMAAWLEVPRVVCRGVLLQRASLGLVASGSPGLSLPSWAAWAFVPGPDWGMWG